MNDGEGCVSPHEFERLGAVRNRRKCRACYLPSEKHPTTSWVPARPLFDNFPHDLTSDDETPVGNG